MIKALLLDFNGRGHNDEPIRTRFIRTFLASGIEVTRGDVLFAWAWTTRRLSVRIGRSRKACGHNQREELTTQKTMKWRERVAGDVPTFRS